MLLSSIRRTDAEHYTWGDACDGWHLVKQATLSVIEERIPPGSAEVLHFHNAAQQFFYILAGEAVMEVGGETIALERGAGLHIPAGTPHRIRNTSEQAVDFLVISQPPSHGDRVVVEDR
jgi:mannose-6-phosphate isomerase-like protein (cupin superfamily)